MRCHQSNSFVFQGETVIFKVDSMYGNLLTFFVCSSVHLNEDAHFSGSASSTKQSTCKSTFRLEDRARTGKATQSTGDKTGDVSHWDYRQWKMENKTKWEKTVLAASWRSVEMWQQLMTADVNDKWATDESHLHRPGQSAAKREKSFTKSPCSTFSNLTLLVTV